MTINDNSEDLEIRIEFERGVGDPGRIFKAMAGLIEATEKLGSHLALSIGTNVKTVMVLQNVEAASLKALLRTVVSELPDEALKAGETKKSLDISC